MDAYYFRRGKTAVLGAIKVQLPFSEGKYQLLNSWSTVPYPTVFSCFLPFEFSATAFNPPWDQLMLAHTTIPLKGHKTIWESRKLQSKPFSYSFLLGAPDWWEVILDEENWAKTWVRKRFSYAKILNFYKARTSMGCNLLIPRKRKQKL